MNRRTMKFSAVSASAVLLAAGLAGPAWAQPCRLSMQAANPVLMPGESTRVDVFAHFPAEGFAFASSQLSVHATIPGWSNVSGGMIAAGHVLNIQASQPHVPQQGIIADPSNPRRVWSGTFTPASYAPALVNMVAPPTAFSFYPSELTSSSVACEAESGHAKVLVNPVPVGPASAAPGDGTTMQTVGDDLIIASNDDDAILIGLLLPAVQKVRLDPTDAVENLRIQMPVHRADGTVADVYTMHFERTPQGYAAYPTLPRAHERGHDTEICQYTGRVLVCLVTSHVAPASLPRLPDTIQTWLEPDGDGARVITELTFDEPIPGPVQPAGQTRRLRFASASESPLVQRDSSLHIFESTGAPEIRLTLEPPCRADADGDGDITSSDISAFLTSWLSSVQNGTLEGDFDGDGVVSSSDISAFLTAWLTALQEGC